MQSNVIFGFIFVAFIFFITAKGELSTYLDILRGGGSQSAPASSGATQQAGLTTNSSTITNAAVSAALGAIVP